MTSKEALNIAFYVLVDNDNDIYNVQEQEKAYRTIAKDLELLDILKKHLKLYNSCYIAINNGINNEDTEIQKENKIIK